MKNIIFFFLLNLCSLSAQTVIMAVTGETVSDQKFCYINDADGLTYLADPSDETKQAMGLVLVGAASDTTQIAFDGAIKWNSGGLSAGKKYYLSSGGGITATKPTRKFQQVGYALDDSTLVLKIGETMRIELTASATLNFPSISTGRSSDLTVTVTGAALNDEVIVSGAAVSNMTFSGIVTAADTVTIRATNTDTSSQDIGSSVFKVTVRK